MIYRVAGHLFEEGKAGSLVDDRGHFYKPIQPGPRGDRERAFYETIHAAKAKDKASWAEGTWSPAAVAAVQAIAAGRQIGDVLKSSSSQRAFDTAQPSSSSQLSTSPRRIPRRFTTPAVPFPFTNGVVMPHFPTFRAEPSFREGAGLVRDPIEVLERDELGLIDEVVVEELLRWSDEEASLSGSSPHSSATSGHSPPTGSSHRHRRDASNSLYSRSPDSASDDGGELDTGRHVMDGVRQAHNNSRGRNSPRAVAAAAAALAGAQDGHTTTSHGHFDHDADNLSTLRRPRRSFSASELDDAENDQAAALLGQTAWHGWTSDDATNGSARNSIDSSSVVANAPPHDANDSNSNQRFWRPLRRGTNGAPNSSMSTDSIEDALRIHALNISAREHAAAAAGPDSINETSEPTGSPSRQSAVTWESMPFTVRNAPLLRVIPKFYGVVHADGRILLELEDLARWYRHPCIMDIKIGHRTWYHHADADYIERCKRKDASTTQAALGFKICGMQVYRHARGGYWRASKRWCKTLPEVLVDKALTSFAHNEHGLRPADVYGGDHGAVAQLTALASWFKVQKEFHLYSASLLILYEGDAQGSEDANVRVRLVDFAHTFKIGQGEHGESGIDDNFLNGLSAFMSRLTAVSRLDVADTLMAAERAGGGGGRNTRFPPSGTP